MFSNLSETFWDPTGANPPETDVCNASTIREQVIPSGGGLWEMLVGNAVALFVIIQQSEHHVGGTNRRTKH